MKTISPKVTNNWSIIGTNFDNPLRPEIIKLANEGLIEVDFNKSLNIKDLEKAGVIKDGKVVFEED